MKNVLHTNILEHIFLPLKNFSKFTGDILINQQCREGMDLRWFGILSEYLSSTPNTVLKYYFFEVHEYSYSKRYFLWVFEHILFQIVTIKMYFTQFRSFEIFPENDTRFWSIGTKVLLVGTPSEKCFFKNIFEIISKEQWAIILQ